MKRRWDENDTGSWRTKSKLAKEFADRLVYDMIERDKNENLPVQGASGCTADQLHDTVATSSTVNANPFIETVSTGSTQEDNDVQDGAAGENESRVDLLCHENMGFAQQYECDDDYFKNGDGLVSYEVPRLIYLPLLSISYYLRHKITKSALSDHLRIIRLNENSYIKELSSLHNLFSKYRHLKTEVRKTYLCGRKKCGEPLRLDKNKKQPLLNQPCGHKRKPTFSPGRECFIIRLPIAKQLAYFIRHNGLAHNMGVDENFRGDITTGGCYKKMRENGMIDERTVTLQLNTDGAELFEKSDFSFWPLMGIINELEYKLRRKYVILLAIYYGNKKPPMKQFLEESFHELNLLQSEGFDVDGVLYKVRVVVVTTDTIARAPLLGMTQFNGAFGCGFCLTEGKRIAKGRGGVRIYPEPFGSNAVPPPLRSIEQHVKDVKEAVKTKKPVRGVVGPTALSALEDFDYIRAQVPEYLHSVCEGVFKLMLNLWTLPKFRKKDWFIGDKSPIIDKRLNEIQPSYEITRTHTSPVSVTKLSTWKASMFRSFFLYYFPILEDLLPTLYFQHLSQLVYGINVLLRERVSVTDVKKVEILFRNFVKDFEILYGEEDLRINIHFMTHLPQAVLDWGALWATSTFIPEWFNGELAKLCSGSQGAVDQMADNYLLQMEIRREVEELISEGSLPSHIVSQFRDYLHLPIPDDDNFEAASRLVCGKKVKLLGAPITCPIDLSLLQESAIKSRIIKEASTSCFDESEISLSAFKLYPRFQILSSKSIFTTTSYTLSPKRANYCALLDDGIFLFIDYIIHFESPPAIHSPQSFIIGRQLGTESQEAYNPEPCIEGIDRLTFDSLPGQTTKLLGISECLLAYRIESIVSKCVIAMKSDLVQKFVVSSLVNNFETD